MKKVLKFNFEGKEGFLSIVERADAYYAIAEKDTYKVKSILETETLEISTELKQPVYQTHQVTVSFDMSLVKDVYLQLEAEKNLYFKALNDTLCVLKIEK